MLLKCYNRIHTVSCEERRFQLQWDKWKLVTLDFSIPCFGSNSSSTFNINQHLDMMKVMSLKTSLFCEKMMRFILICSLNNSGGNCICSSQTSGIEERPPEPNVWNKRAHRWANVRTGKTGKWVQNAVKNEKHTKSSQREWKQLLILG